MEVLRSLDKCEFRENSEIVLPAKVLLQSLDVTGPPWNCFVTCPPGFVSERQVIFCNPVGICTALYCIVLLFNINGHIFFSSECFSNRKHK